MKDRINEILENTGLLYSQIEEATAQIEQLLVEAQIEGAVMGARFGNAAFRQYNIANPSKPINLDTTLQMGIEQAKKWAEEL